MNLRNIKFSLAFNFQKKFFAVNLRPDYIIVGGGSAGCVLANRLSEDENNKILLLEAGHNDKGNIDSWKIEMPAALTYNISTEKYNWNYYTEPQLNINNRKLIWPRGKVLGGSSSLNAMCYVRGNALDYERWGNVIPGWQYKHCLPYFKKAQTHQYGENEYRGGNGPINVSRSIIKNRLADNFINAGIELGYNYTEDMNGYQQEGFGPMDATIHEGKRFNTSTAYLSKIKHRKNLDVQCNSFVKRVLFDYKTAIGVEVIRNNQLIKIYANKEIILSGGAINSPQILLLSGVGNSNELEKLKIKPVHNLPEVGENLQDHLEVYLQYECKNPISIKDYANWLPPHKKILAGIEWFLFKKGMCTSNHFHSGAFIRSKKGIEFPDIQLHFFPCAVESQKDILNIHAYQVHCGTMRPKSRGKLKLISNNPFIHPSIQPNLLSEVEDLEDLCDGVRLSIEVLKAKAFSIDRHYPINFDERMVGNDIQLKTWIKNHVESAYHCSGTCAMGKVTESDGRVKGVRNLRVCDASIMPYLISGNTNAPTIMIAEKISDSIRNRNLPESTAKFYVSPNWRTHQR